MTKKHFHARLPRWLQRYGHGLFVLSRTFRPFGRIKWEGKPTNQRRGYVRTFLGIVNAEATNPVYASSPRLGYEALVQLRENEIYRSMGFFGQQAEAMRAVRKHLIICWLKGYDKVGCELCHKYPAAPALE